MHEYSQCQSEYSFWYEIPKGSKAGIPGSPEKPRYCVSDEIVSEIYLK